MEARRSRIRTGTSKWWFQPGCILPSESQWCPCGIWIQGSAPGLWGARRWPVTSPSSYACYLILNSWCSIYVKVKTYLQYSSTYRHMHACLLTSIAWNYNIWLSLRVSFALCWLILIFTLFYVRILIGISYDGLFKPIEMMVYCLLIMSWYALHPKLLEASELIS